MEILMRIVEHHSYAVAEAVVRCNQADVSVVRMSYSMGQRKPSCHIFVSSKARAFGVRLRHGWDMVGKETEGVICLLAKDISPKKVIQLLSAPQNETKSPWDVYSHTPDEADRIDTDEMMRSFCADHLKRWQGMTIELTNRID